jgi:hypothetical protein
LRYQIGIISKLGIHTTKTKSDTGSGGLETGNKNTIGIITEFEKILEKHFGPTGVYILNVQINNLGRTKEMVQKEDLEHLIQSLKDELIKVIRYDVEMLEKELREIISSE